MPSLTYGNAPLYLVASNADELTKIRSVMEEFRQDIIHKDAYALTKLSASPFAAMVVVAARPQFTGCQVFAPRLSTITPALDSCSRSHIAKHQLLHATRQLQARSQSPRLLIGRLQD
jgi:hypothetical protein